MSAILNDTPVPVVLIVDDDSDLREMLRLFFKRAAYVLIEAASGEAALAACQVQRPDLILLDMMMPDMDGVTACEKIRARTPSPKPSKQALPIT